MPTPAMNTTMSLLREQPDPPPLRHGVLDLLGDDEGRARFGGLAQRLWESGPGSEVYARAMAASRRYIGPLRPRIDALHLQAGARVLDIGCGPGDITTRLGRAVGPGGLAVGLDLSRPMLAIAARDAADNVAHVRADATKLPFADGAFDAVHSAYAIQLVPDPAGMITEMARVLRPGGRLSLLTPGDAAPSDSPVNGAVWKFGRIRLLSANELSGLATDAGLTESAGHSLVLSQLLTATKPQ